jgi:two-component system nitrogen regulation response regulator GlnG
VSIRRAIVADDDDDARFLVAGALRKAGFGVTEATDGLELLTLAAGLDSEKFLVVSDIGMPGCDGITLTQALRGRAARLPIVLITAYTDSATKRHAFRAGADRVLHKPLDLRQLVDAVVELADRPD